MKFLIHTAYGSVYTVLDGELVAFTILSDNTFNLDDAVSVDFTHVDSEEMLADLLRIRELLS